MTFAGWARKTVVGNGVGLSCNVGQAQSVSDASKIVLPSIIDTSLFTLDDVKLAELTNNSFE